MPADPVHVVVMGVSATGKTTIAEAMCLELGYDFIEGDSLHPPANIAKMEAGIPLDDDDREPWLRAIAERIGKEDADGTSTIVTCSALKRKYRDVLRSATSAHEPFFVHLNASFEVLEGRMALRTKHFMPTSLLHSQFEALEPLGADENGVAVDVTPPVEAVVAAAVKAVRDRYPG